ncbi:10633_t:CDS:2 [Funneliformis geosporum]|uniref:4059_t:CDS:1 n=1 Tax=Funneliformis geosporum TaxID=1117311 RepID=A0A9W4X2H1_9GLOM|nr:4059_t:CDS:2 [Funneliformis geosporum]CAI2181730.1 10633_t:CDS:2 [Funneliformis geosporum]
MSLLSVSSDETSVVVAIDFGTTFSGFAFANKVKPEDFDLNNINLNTIW